MNLRAVRHDRGQVRRQARLDLDARGNRRAQELQGIVDCGLHVHERAGLFLAAAEREDLTDEAGGSIAGPVHLGQAALDGIVRRQGCLDEREITPEDGKNVVEVMSDATGDRA